MTDKEIIRKEVERLQKELIKNDENGFGSDIDNACILELQNVLTYIDSLQEELVRKDLEEAAHSYVDTTIEWFDSEGNPCCYPAFIAGAQWQKQQLIERACEWLKENKEHPFIECEDPCLSGYLTNDFIEDFRKAMEE